MLTRTEYERLCKTAESSGKERLLLILQTICGTGIRVSELRYVTVEALRDGAGVDPQKVFPHNLRHLFARTFYELEKDIARLADILGHSSVETTRIYIISTGQEHLRTMEKMRLIL